MIVDGNKYEYCGEIIDLTKPIRFPNHKFTNTAEFKRTGEYFLKNGVYTKAHPQWDKIEHKQFWDEEERRCKEGYSVGGVRVTGDHYAYLNFRQIRLTKEDNKELKARGISEKVIKNLYHSAQKQDHFPDFWDGDFEYYHAKDIARLTGKHLAVGKARRKGYSFKNSTIVGNTYNFNPKSVSVIGAFLSDYLYPEGTMAMTVSYIDFLNKHTDWVKRRLHNSMEYVESGFQYAGSTEKHGFQSKIITVSFKDKPGAARGKDAQIILLEEAGKFPNLKASYKATYDATKDGIYTTGLIIIFGTGGDDATNWEDFEELAYEPEANGLLVFENIWDDESGENGEVFSFFHPDYKNLVGFMDEEGNSLVEQAKNYEEQIRERIRKESSDPNAADNRAMEHANKPSEAFKRSANNILPVTRINDRIKQIKYNDDIKYLSRNGILEFIDGKLKFITNEELQSLSQTYHQPITEFPLKNTKDLHGCIQEWHPPYRMSNGQVPKGMYRIWHDPYAVDKDLKNITLKDSLGAAYVFERPNMYTRYKGQRLVASYVGRPPRVDDYNDQLFYLAEYYQAEIFYENDRGEVKPYAQRKKKLHFLASEPEMLWNKELAAKTGRGYGMHMNDARKGMGILYLRDLMNLVVYTDEETGQQKTFLDYINDLALLEEARKWKLKGNFDRMSALLVGMYDMKEEEDKIVKYVPDNGNIVKPNFFNRQMF